MKTLHSILIATVSVFLPVQGLLTTSAILIAVDLISGVVAAHKRKEPITSSGLRRTISKLFVYEIALILAFLAETYMMPMIPVTKMVSSLVALTELKSIYENLDSITGGDLLKTIISKLGSDNSRIDHS